MGETDARPSLNKVVTFPFFLRRLAVQTDPHSGTFSVVLQQDTKGGTSEG